MHDAPPTRIRPSSDLSSMLTCGFNYPLTRLRWGPTLLAVGMPVRILRDPPARARRTDCDLFWLCVPHARVDAIEIMYPSS